MKFSLSFKINKKLVLVYQFINETFITLIPYININEFQERIPVTDTSLGVNFK